MQVESPKEKSLVRLDRIAEDINAKFAEAIRFAGESARNGRAAIVSAIECGKLLTRAKAATKHGEWEKWLLDNCGDISQETARKWMILSKSNHGGNLEDCKTLRQAYITCGILPEPTKEAKALGTATVDIFASFVEQIARECDRICSIAEGWELTTIPDGRKDELRAAIDRVKKLEERL